ncbi:MAG TPA: hypothetical protein VL651_10270, partial [Bacteroidia bacterium]|nr:hypothetical protein [Bacteroidia bacterium]
LFFLRMVLLSGAAFLILEKFDFEPGSPLKSLLPVVFGAVLVNYWLPRKFSLCFLFLASCAGSFLLLDPLNAGALIVLLLLFGLLMRTGIGINLKIFISILFIAALLLIRISIVHVPFFSYAIPVAGSMLMFRGALVLYEHKYAKEKPTFIEDLSYLFLLPNLALPLFPVIDYKTFLRNHTPSDRVAINKGIERISLAILQLLIYRFFYTFITPPLSTVHDAGSTLLYITSSYAGIMHFTGLLWLGVGCLGLLGFDLPFIFNNVFLVDSFSDIWRRINIYWKDFITKLVYFPVYFLLRKKIKQSVLITVLITFIFTAVLHGWQWIWLLGIPKISPSGIIYWGILGTCIAIALSRESKKTPVPEKVTMLSSAWRCIRIMLMFLFMSFTWSLWNSPSFNDWFFLLSHFRTFSFDDIFKIASSLIIIFFLLFFGLNFNTGVKDPVKWNRISARATIWLMLLVLPFGFYQVVNIFPAPIREYAWSLNGPELNSDDRDYAIENYYDQMLAVNGGRHPWEMFIQAPGASSGLDKACTARQDVVIRELIPSLTTDLGTWKIITNSFGMRSKEYPMQKGKNVFRIAILGGSYEMGSGVAQDSVFGNVLEEMLQDSFPELDIQVLNFAVGGYHPPQQVWVMQNKIKQFSPDLVLYFVHPEDRSRLDAFLANMVHNGYDLHFAELKNIRTRCGAKQSMSVTELQNRFEPYNSDISHWAISTVLDSADEWNEAMYIVYLPTMNSDDILEDNFYRNELTLAPAYEKKNLHYISLHGIFASDPDHWKLKTDPSHPNAAAHQLIAERLFSELYPTLAFIENK